MSAPKLSEQALRKSASHRLAQYSHHVPFSSCIYWAGAVNEHGYGIMSVGRGRTMKAHRVAFSLANGLPLSKNGSAKSVVRHSCDNPACVNPMHLDEGTQGHNNADKMVRDRVPFGTKHHRAKLTEDIVAKILTLLPTVSQIELAKTYGVNPSVISRIKTGGAWRRVEGV